MIEVIKKQGYSWHLSINGVECSLIGTSLYIGNRLYPLPANADSGLRWRVRRKWVSYRQIKKALKQLLTSTELEYTP